MLLRHDEVLPENVSGVILGNVAALLVKVWRGWGPVDEEGADGRLARLGKLRRRNPEDTMLKPGWGVELERVVAALIRA